MTVVLLVAVVDELTKLVGNLREAGIEVSVANGDIVGKFYVQHGNVLVKILVAKVPAPSQGGDAAAYVTARLVERFQPYFLAMTGLCAGDAGEGIRLGDVVVASATVRHDFGKITKRWRYWPFKFEHRREALRIESDFANALAINYSKPTYHENGFYIHFGVMSTGNQVTKIAGIFSYLKKKVMAGLPGDEQHRGLKGIDMEAYAVAYVAEKSGAPKPLWLVVKGVCDHADRRKSDARRDLATENAYTVTLDILKRIVIPRFVDEHEKQGEEAEQQAQQEFAAGRITKAADAARRAYSLGRRSVATRRRYLMSLTQFGDFKAARDVIDEYRASRVLYDSVTRELDATMLWRHGMYQKACEILPDEEIQGNRQLIYLRAISELFLREPENPASGGGVSAPHLLQARTRLEEALRTGGSTTNAWWIQVNLFWVLRLLEEVDAAREADQVFESARDSLDRAIQDSRYRGTPRLYLLFLLAAANRRSEFEGVLTAFSDRSVAQLSLETIDMVFERLRMLERRKRLGRVDFQFYWASICAWSRRVRTVGRLSRDSTELNEA